MLRLLACFVSRRKQTQAKLTRGPESQASKRRSATRQGQPAKHSRGSKQMKQAKQAEQASPRQAVEPACQASEQAERASKQGRQASEQAANYNSNNNKDNEQASKLASQASKANPSADLPRPFRGASANCKIRGTRKETTTQQRSEIGALPFIILVIMTMNARP